MLRLIDGKMTVTESAPGPTCSATSSISGFVRPLAPLKEMDAGRSARPGGPSAHISETEDDQTAKRGLPPKR